MHVHASPKPLLLLLLLSAIFPALARARNPAWVAAEVIWEDRGETRRITGQLTFDQLPVERLESGNVRINNLVPLEDGDIVIRVDGQHENQPRFVLRDYQGEHPFVWQIRDLPVQTQGGGMRGLEIGEGFGRDPLMDLTLDGPSAEAEEETEESAVTLIVPSDPPVNHIPVGALREIRFLARADGGFTRAMYTGRFVSYHRAAAGDNGTVQPVAATFLGGEGDDHIHSAGFLSDGRIFATGMFHDLSFLSGVTPQVLGRDNRHSDFPAEVRTDRRGREYTVHPAETPALFIFSPDLSRVESAVRLPWGAARLSSIQIGPDNEIYVLVRAAEGVDGLLAARQPDTIIPYPEAVERATARAEARGHEVRLGPNSYLFRLRPDLRSIDWMVRFEHTGLEQTLSPDQRILVRRDQQIFFVDTATGQVETGPVIPIGRGRPHVATVAPRPHLHFTGLVVDPRNGNFFIGGEYHSPTGLEPWRNPFLYKFLPDGTPKWTAYDWTGPIVGVEFLRYVSDSAIIKLEAGINGKLLFSGWSDGGNSVFTRNPYDLRRPVDVGGMASSIWGANVLSVAYLVQMDADTMDVSGVTRLLSYLPTTNSPNSISLRAFHQLDSGDVAVFGSSAFGLIETHDGWFNPWWIQYQTNRHAQARGGSFFRLYRDGLREFRMSTILPGVTTAHFASRGTRLLVFGSARERNNAYGDETPTWIQGGVQTAFGGGDTDGYLLLIETAADPQPPVIPERTW
jgi:hypothetical protein